MVAVSAGQEHSLALTARGAVWSWGNGRNGQLGHGDELMQWLPKHIVAMKKKVVALSAGFVHSLAVTVGGAAYSWGRGRNGHLGHGNWEDQRLPKHIAALSEGVVAVSASGSHSLAMTASGAVWSWGQGGQGQLGHGQGGACPLATRLEALV